MMYNVKWAWETFFLAAAAGVGYILSETAKQDMTQWKLWLPVVGAAAARIAIAVVISRIKPV